MARRCTAERPHRYRDMTQVHLALEGRSQRSFYLLIFTLVALVAIIVGLILGVTAK